MFLKEFLGGFPLYESHYTRRNNPHRKYFAPGLNATILYEFYTKKCEEEGKAPLKLWALRHCLRYDFNIGFHAPLQNTCKMCDILKAKEQTLEAEGNEEELNEVKVKRELHLRRAQAAQDDYSMHKTEAIKEGSGETVFTFDLMKTLPTPVVSTGIVYYKRQLWTYNLGVHS